MNLHARLTAMAALVLLVAVGLVAILDVMAFSRSYHDAVRGRHAWSAEELAASIDGALALGLPVKNATDQVTRKQAGDASIRWITVVDPAGTVILSAGPAPDHPLAALKATDSGTLVIARPLAGSFGTAESAGTLLLAWDGGEVTTAVQQMALTLVGWGLALLVPAVALVALVGRWLAARDQRWLDRLRRRITGESTEPADRDLEAALGGDPKLAPAGRHEDSSKIRAHLLCAFALVVALVGFNVTAVREFESALVPAVEARSQAVATTIGSTVAHALKLGVPPDRLRGVEDEIRNALEASPSLSWGEVLVNGSTYRAGASNKEVRVLQVPMSTGSQDAATASIQLGIRLDHLRNTQLATLLDLAAILVVSLLVAYEILNFAIAQGVVRPLTRLRSAFSDAAAGRVHKVEALPGVVGEVATAWNQRVASASSHEAGTAQISAEDRFGKLYRIRLPLFLLIFAEALSISFMPLYAGHLLGPGDDYWLKRQVLVGLPIAAFMIAWAISQPFAGSWSDRVGRRRSLLIGMGLAAVGLLLSGFAQTLWDLILWRTISGLGYGIGFIACTAYVQDHTTTTNRGRGMAVFVWAFSAGTLCGASIGGVVADRLGHSQALWLSTTLVLTGMAAVRWCVEEYRPSQAREPLRMSQIGDLAHNHRFAALSLFAAIPPKFIITGVNAFVLPLYLTSPLLGLSQAATGRTLMAFNLATIVLSELSAPLADKWSAHRAFVIAGGVVAGLALLLTRWWEGPWAILAVVTLLGVANGLGQAPLLALVPRVCDVEVKQMGAGTVMGIFRMTERIGSILGPLAAGTMIAVMGFVGTLEGIGWICLATIGAFALMPVATARNGAKS
ncbi:hypothetical protein LBMAG53_03300 [Planctomycetota bacterium]|nr:hypothetical protein LBMAG53_03300 [Planctomycetota bacterium]